MLPLRDKFKKATATPKGKIITYSVLLIFVGVITTAIVYWNVIKKSFIRDKVKITVQEKSNRLYDIHYDDMELDEVTGYLSVTNMKLNFDSAQYKILQQQHNAPSILFRIAIPVITVSGVKTPQALITKEITGGKLQISNPVIDILYTHQGEDSTKKVPPEEVYKQILGELKQIKIDTLLVTGAKITTRDIKTGKQDLLMMNTYVQLRDVAIDSISNKDTTRLLFARHIDIGCSKLNWAAKNRMYTYTVDSMLLHSDEQRVTAGSFKVIPTLGEEAYAKKKGVQADRYNISLDKVEINAIDFQQLFKENIKADNVVINHATIKIYRDMTLPPDGKNRIGSYPQQRVEQIPLPVEIHKLVLKNSYIEYKEKGRIVQKIGKVIFSDLNGTFTNITNKKGLVAANNRMQANISGKFLNKFPVQTEWTFYLLNPKGRFDVKGKLGSLDAREINVLIEPLGGARVEKGRINGLTFDFKADDYKMEGPVKFLYEGLKISVLKKDEETNELKKKKLVSFGANMLVKDDNPTKDKPARISNVHFVRDTTRSMFHLSWKSLMEGIKEAAMPK